MDVIMGKSNFEFLSKYWPDLAELGEAAETYLYQDANTCIFKLGNLCERLVLGIFYYEKLTIPEDNRQVNLIKILKREQLLPKNIDDILFAVRKARNEAVHLNKASVDKAKTLLRMCFNLSVWYMEVYGDWDFSAPKYIEPENKSVKENFTEIIAAHEEKLLALTEQIEHLKNTQATDDMTSEERKKKSLVVSEDLELSSEEEQYLVGEQVRMDLSIVPVVNYALQQNRLPLIQSLVINNNSDLDILGADIVVKAEPAFCESYIRHVELIPGKSDLEIKNINIKLDGSFLASMSERMTGDLEVSLVVEGEVLYSETNEITVLAFDEWQGLVFYPELLVSYITPNHPQIAKIIKRGSDILKRWTGDSAFDAYQSRDPQRVLKQAAAIYRAVKELNISYVVSPPSFGVVGQRIRLCDNVIQQRMGNCMDLSLLYCACLEAVGLNPLLVTKPNHIFAGVWLDNLTFPEVIQDDKSLISKRIASGVNELEVVECTLLVEGSGANFDDAVKYAENEIEDEEKPIEYIIDVKRARYSGIKPLPLRIKIEDSWEVDENRESKKLTIINEPSLKKIVIDVQDEKNREVAMPKMQLWERKLLDLGMRNSLVNLRMSKKMIPILTHSLDKLEDSLATGEQFTLYARPDDWHIPLKDMNFENISDLGKFERLIESEFKNKRIRSALGESDLNRISKDLYRTAKASIEENGANTLYLTIGLLRWYETKRSKTPRYAPLIMLPVEMVRKAGSLGYSIRLRDEEPQFNISILEKIKQDYKIGINGLDPLPLDDQGIDVRKVFTIVRKGVMSQKGWDVLESAYLGIFSFSQFVMWNDVKNRSDDLVKNKVVKSLIDGKIAWDAQGMEIGDKVDEKDVFLPIPTDASQLYAIETAGKGKSFVLHGPPGTGKSQTITALIANALAQEKTVLFVAEKMAALEVVQKRLEAISLGPFCLELHSNKSKKKDVLEQLRAVTEITKDVTANEYAIKAEQIEQERRELDLYAEDLHKKQRCGLSVYELINKYVTYSGYPDMKISKNYNVNSTQLANSESLVNKIVVAAKDVGHPCENPLMPIKLNEYSQELKISASEYVEDYLEYLIKFKSIIEEFASTFELPLVYDFDSLDNYYLVASNLKEWILLPREWGKQTELNQYLAMVLKLSHHIQEKEALYNRIVTNWNDTIFNEDGNVLQNELNQINGKWFLPKMLGMNGLVKRLSVHAKSVIDKTQLENTFSDLIKFKEEKQIVEELMLSHGAGLDEWIGGDEKHYDQLEEAVNNAKRIASSLEQLTESDAIRVKFAGIQKYSNIYDEVKDIWEKLFDAEEKVCELLKISKTSSSEKWLLDRITTFSNIKQNINGLRSWIFWKNTCREAEKHRLSFVVDAYEMGMSHDDIVGAYKKSIYRHLAIIGIDNSSSLNAFSGTIFDEKVEHFKKLDDEIRVLTQQEIYNRLAAKLPDFTREAIHSSELGILQRAIRSGGRGISIRKLFEQIPTLLPRLCPCMLMSPISAAQYLDTKRPLFDLVVFDEASQLPTCKAIGALARGENAIIVGDPKQMPPTSFFANSSVDEENLDLEDLESILDDCLAINLPQTHLLWHYRSRHESLIAFSNSKFYDNKLYTFPSVNDRQSKVNYVHVDGFFDRGKTRQNIKEAEAIVEEIKRRCYDDELSKYSVGVVTFNISQQNLIDDLLSEACVEDERLEKWVYETEEPLFIKNLENVQGDERDVILFSIGYGPDKEGKVYMNFGPLNREGGWRRLNVAISRARYEMIVFSTLTPDQINLSKTSAEGVAALKGFLEYAAGHSLTVDENSAIRKSSSQYGIVDEICRRLSKEGYDTDCNVGHSEYRVDIGVINPENPDEYILGIMLDGPNYEKAKTTRDREISQASVLEGLGWNVLRVWTIEWWEDKEKEFNRILDAIANTDNDKKVITPNNKIKALDNNNSERIKVPVSTKNTYEKAPENKSSKTHVQLYKSVELKETQLESAYEFYRYEYERDIALLAQKIIQAEAPITENLLARKVAQGFGFKKAGSKMAAHISYLCKDWGFYNTVLNDQKIYWASKEKSLDYHGFRACGEEDDKRNAVDVPLPEIINTMCYVLFENGNLPTDILIKESAKLLGYARMGVNVKNHFEEALSIASKTGRINVDNANCSLHPDEMQYVDDYRANLVTELS